MGFSEGPFQDTSEIQLNAYKNVIFLVDFFLIFCKIFMATNDFLVYEPLPFDWISNILEKKDDISITYSTKQFSFNNQNEKSTSNLTLKPMAIWPMSKKSNFAQEKGRRSKSSLKNLFLNSTEIKQINYSKMNKTNIIVDEENSQDNQMKFDQILKDEIESYNKKDLDKKLKQKYRARKTSTFHQFSYGMTIG